MVSALNNIGADVQYVEVPGGNHTNVVEPNFVAMFDFFDRFPKR
jgi:hypothetical protein